MPVNAAPEGQPDRSQGLHSPWEAKKEDFVPEGRGEQEVVPRAGASPGSHRPSGTEVLLTPHPALKCRATLRLPLRGGTRVPPRKGVDEPKVNAYGASALGRAPSTIEG